MHPQPLQICDKAQGPRQSNQNPVYSWRVQPLNYVHSSTSPTTIKKRKYHTCKDVLLPEISCKTAAVCLLINGKKVVVASGYNPGISENGDPKNSGKLFNTHSTDRWKSKKGQQFTLLRRITRLKTVNSDVVLLSTVSLERLSPRGSYHLDGTGMSDTLNQKHHCELLVWSASVVHKQSNKIDRFALKE